MPDRREDLQHVGRVDLRDGPAADAREDVPLHAPDPVLRVPPATPAAALLFEYALGGFGERRHSLYAAFLGEGIAARTGQHAVGESLLAGLGERDERGGAESEFAQLALEHPAQRLLRQVGGRRGEAVTAGASVSALVEPIGAPSSVVWGRGSSGHRSKVVEIRRRCRLDGERDLARLADDAILPVAAVFLRHAQGHERRGADSDRIRNPTGGRGAAGSMAMTEAGVADDMVASVGRSRGAYERADLEHAVQPLLGPGRAPPRCPSGSCEPFISDHVGPLRLRPDTAGREMNRNGRGRPIVQVEGGVVADAEPPRRLFRKALGVRQGARRAPASRRGSLRNRQRVQEPIGVPMRRSAPRVTNRSGGRPGGIGGSTLQRAATERAVFATGGSAAFWTCVDHRMLW